MRGLALMLVLVALGAAGMLATLVLSPDPDRRATARWTLTASAVLFAALGGLVGLALEIAGAHHG